MTDDLDALAMDLCRLSGKRWTKRGARLWRARAAALQVLANARLTKDEAMAEAQRIMRGGV